MSLLPCTLHTGPRIMVNNAIHQITQKIAQLPRQQQVDAVANLPADERDDVVNSLFSPLMRMGFKAEVEAAMDARQNVVPRYFVPQSRRNCVTLGCRADLLLSTDSLRCLQGAAPHEQPSNRRQLILRICVRCRDTLGGPARSKLMVKASSLATTSTAATLTC